MASHLYGYGGASSGAGAGAVGATGGLSSVYSEAALRYLASSSDSLAASDSSKYSLADHHRMYLTHTADALSSYSADSLLSGVKRSAEGSSLFFSFFFCTFTFCFFDCWEIPFHSSSYFIYLISPHLGTHYLCTVFIFKC